jgi:hypothetical protein
VSLGERPDLLGAQIDLLARLGAPTGGMRTTLDAIKAIEQALADRRCLLVVDDVWTAAGAQAFDVAGPAGRVLYTTRDHATLRDVGADVRRIKVLEALQLAGQLAKKPTDHRGHPTSAWTVDNRCALTSGIASSPHQTLRHFALAVVRSVVVVVERFACEFALFAGSGGGLCGEVGVGGCEMTDADELEGRDALSRGHSASSRCAVSSLRARSCSWTWRSRASRSRLNVVDQRRDLVRQ